MAGAVTRMSPAEIHDAARDSCPELGLATVYRTLELLEKLGVVKRVHMSDHCEAFAPAALREGHHVVCIRCGRVAEFEGCNVAALIPLAVQQTGFRVEEHFLELMGMCAVCQQQGEDEGAAMRCPRDPVAVS
jgi:Fur family transcriptional regulator, ferric uptake regulator